MTQLTSDTMRWKFLVHAQRDAGLNLGEAELVADFFTAVGDEMLGKLTPMLVGYRERIENQVRAEVVAEIHDRLQTIGNFSFSKRMVLEIIKTYTPEEGSNNEQSLHQGSNNANSTVTARK